MEPTGVMTETERAIERQPEILARDWRAELHGDVRRAMRGTRSVAFIGTGTSFHCALWAHWLCRHYGGPRPASRAVMAWDFLAGDRCEGCELFAVISHRGDRALTRRVLKAMGAKRRVLLAGEGSPSRGHPVLHTSPPERSGAHTMSLMGAIGACSEIVASLVPAADAKRLRAGRQAAAALLAAADARRPERLRALRGTLATGRPAYFVGGGPFHAVALELALKAREMAHLQAEAYNTEEFLHGPLAGIERNDTVVLLPPRGRAASPLQDLLNHQRLASCRRAARAVGARVIQPTLAPAAALLDAPWQAVLSLYWGQLACLAAAERSGVNPDLTRRDRPAYKKASKYAELHD